MVEQRCFLLTADRLVNLIVEIATTKTCKLECQVLGHEFPLLRVYLSKLASRFKTSGLNLTKNTALSLRGGKLGLVILAVVVVVT
jgi:hypothetical protein